MFFVHRSIGPWVSTKDICTGANLHPQPLVMQVGNLASRCKIPCFFCWRNSWENLKIHEILNKLPIQEQEWTQAAKSNSHAICNSCISLCGIAGWIASQMSRFGSGRVATSFDSQLVGTGGWVREDGMTCNMGWLIFDFEAWYLFGASANNWLQNFILGEIGDIHDLIGRYYSQ